MGRILDVGYGRRVVVEDLVRDDWGDRDLGKGRGTKLVVWFRICRRSLLIIIENI